MSKSSVKKNFSYQMIYEITILILPFVTSPYLARVIGADGVGTYTYTYTMANYFVLCAMLGIKNYGNRLVARNREDPKHLNEIFSSLLFLHIIVSLICFAAYIVYAFFIAENRSYALIQTLFVASAIFDISWFYFGIEKFKLTVARSTTIKIVNVICIFAFVKDKNDLWVYTLIMALGFFLSQITLWLPLKKYVKIVKTSSDQIIRHLKPLLVLFVPVIAFSLYRYMDKIMIGKLSSKVQLGLYENADKLMNMPLTVIVSFGTVMLPKMANLASKKDSEMANRYLAQSMKYVMCLAFALACGLAGVSRVFAPVFWGDEFIVTGDLSMALAISIPFISFANVIRTQYLIPNSKDTDYLVSVILGAVTNLTINFLMIPKYGAMGATIGTVVTEMIVCLSQSFSVRKALPLWSYVKNFAIFIVFGLMMFVPVYLIGEHLGKSIMTLVIQVAVGVAVYGTLALIYFWRTKDEQFFKILNRFVKKKA